VKVEKRDHSVMKGFLANWKTPKDELYVVQDTTAGMTSLATLASQKNSKIHAVI
jgi:hypothetical protein